MLSLSQPNTIALCLHRRQSNGDDPFWKKTVVAGTLKVVDYFILTDQQSLEDNDVDFGIAGPLLLPPQSGPVPNELIGGGKGAILYVLNRSNMGKYCASCNPPDSQVVQKVSSSELFGTFSTPDVLEGLCLSVLRQRSSACVQVGQGQTIGQSGCADFCHFPLSRNHPRRFIEWTKERNCLGTPQRFR